MCSFGKRSFDQNAALNLSLVKPNLTLRLPVNLLHSTFKSFFDFI